MHYPSARSHVVLGGRSLISPFSEPLPGSTNESTGCLRNWRLVAARRNVSSPRLQPLSFTCGLAREFPPDF